MSKTCYEFSKLNWFENVESRPHPHPGLAWLSAMLYVPDVKKAMKCYETAFGIVPIFQLAQEDGTLLFVRMRYRGINFTLNKEGFYSSHAKAPVTSKTPSPFTFYLYVDDVHATLKQATESGCTLLDKPVKEFWGDLRARVEDPFGYVWDIATRVE